MTLKEASLKEFLEYKTLYYDKIDFSIVNSAWKVLKKHINLPYVIHIVGTNGKGSTGRFLATYLYKKKFNVLHYSSPHIRNFNERIWINGSDICNIKLETAHKKIKKIIPTTLLEKLTYFEYTTLLALFLSNNFDYIVLEAGLGGEFDATNVVKNSVSLITTIDFDHQEFLGNTIDKIAKTKMRACDNHMIVGYQIHKEIEKLAFNVKKELKDNFNKEISIDIIKNFDEYNMKLNFPSYLKKNLYLAIAALKYLKIHIDLNLFEGIKLRGRCEKIASNITIDVGHNPLAASVLKDEFKNKKIVLIYNSYKNKDYEKILQILKPIIKELIIIDIENEKMINKYVLLDVCNKYDIKVTSTFKIDKKSDYLVFGSFLVVEKFLDYFQSNKKS